MKFYRKMKNIRRIPFIAVSLSKLRINHLFLYIINFCDLCIRSPVISVQPLEHSLAKIYRATNILHVTKSPRLPSARSPLMYWWCVHVYVGMYYCPINHW